MAKLSSRAPRPATAATKPPAPAPGRGRNRAEPQLHLLRLLPNLVSILALCAGLTAVRLAMQDQVSQAVLLIVLAAFLDALDGRLARMLGSESAIGAELDSLCDVINFGVVPGLVVYFAMLQGEASFGWIAVLIYTVCCMLRLARFNVGSRAAEPQEKTGFIGVPSPAGAMLAMAPIYISHVFGAFDLPAMTIALWLVVVGALMISRVPTPSLKRLRVSAASAPFALVGAVAVVALMITYPWRMLLAFCTFYSLALLWCLAVCAKKSVAQSRAQAAAPSVAKETDEA